MSADDNVVQRLKERLAEARARGFRVRLEVLDGQQATWCEIAGAATLFVDLSQTAAEQLQQLEETLTAYARWRGAAPTGASDAVSPLGTDNNLENRAA